MARTTTKKHRKRGEPIANKVKPRKKRYYMDDERFAALAALKVNGGNVHFTSQKLGIPEPTLRAWASGFRSQEALQLYEEKGGDAARAFETILWEIIPVARTKLHDAPLNHLMTAAGIASDKLRLFRGEPTTIAKTATTNTTGEAETLLSLVKDMHPDERDRFRELLSAVVARRDAAGPTQPQPPRALDGTR